MDTKRKEMSQMEGSRGEPSGQRDYMVPTFILPAECLVYVK
jgi:hypothetical protein